MKLDKKIFREYDIRGVYEKDYDNDFAYLLGRAISVYLKKTFPGKSHLSFALGRDARISGTALFSSLSAAFLDEGIDVIDLGVVPTPLVYYSLHQLEIDGAVCITGSHNPPDYNGFKICVGKTTIYGKQIQELFLICQEIQKNVQKNSVSSKKGALSKKDIVSPYLEEIAKRIPLDPKKRGLKIIVDCGNGAACAVAPKLFQKMGFDAKILFGELDGTFPNHHPDPTEIENLEDLIREVKASKADLGIAYDGDADRIGVVDDNGRPVFGDELLVLYAREILSRKPGSTVISEVKSSTKLYDDIKKHGGNPVMWKTGHSLIKTKMKEVHAEVAGEMSGHVFFADRYYGFDDAIYASIRLLEILSNTKEKISSLLSDLPQTVSTPEIRVDCDDEIKFKVVEEVCSRLSKKYKTIDIDGVRIETKEGWGLLRASNTQPVVVMRFEAKNEKDLNHLRSIIEGEFEAAKSKFLQK